MKNKIQNIIKDYGLDKAISIVAVSGGVDSVVLLDILSKELVEKNLIIAHVNHGLRKTSSGEAKFVRDLARKYGLPYREQRLNLVKRDEATARQQRYRWLRSLARKEGASYIVTAHHLDDQLETTILNLVRGTGPLEIWGMREEENEILRPLLSFTKADLLAYAHKHRLKSCQDESNLDTNYARNRIRHNVIPELRRINPKLDQTFKREYQLGQQAADAARELTESLYHQTTSSGWIEIKKLARMAPFLQKELMKRLLHHFTGREADIYQKNIETVLDLIDKDGSKKTKIGKLEIEKTYRELIFHKSPVINQREIKLKPGATEFNGFTFTLGASKGKATKNRFLLPAEFSDNLRVRTWRPGDRIRTNYGSKKIQDVFTDAKVDRRERQRWPLVTHQGEIIWAVKLQAGKIENNNKKIMIEVK